MAVSWDHRFHAEIYHPFYFLSNSIRIDKNNPGGIIPNYPHSHMITITNHFRSELFTMCYSKNKVENKYKSWSSNCYKNTTHFKCIFYSTFSKHFQTNTSQNC